MCTIAGWPTHLLHLFSCGLPRRHDLLAMFGSEIDVKLRHKFQASQLIKRKLEACSWEPRAGFSTLETGSRKPDAGSREPGARSREPETGSWKSGLDQASQSKLRARRSNPDSLFNILLEKNSKIGGRSGIPVPRSREFSFGEFFSVRILV